MQFKGGYVIDEFEEILLEFVDKKVIDKFYESKLFFKVVNLTENLNFIDSNPLLKIVWNIINRGEPTRASLKITDYILTKNLGKLYSGFNSHGSEIKFQIDKKIKNEINSENLLKSLEKYSVIPDFEINEFKNINLLIYSVLNDLITIGQVQKSILLILLHYNSEKIVNFNFNLIGLDHSLSNIIFEDLNELFDSINNMVLPSETKLNKLINSKSSDTISIAFNTQENCNYKIESNLSDKNNYLYFILTDRRISYKELGNSIANLKTKKNGFLENEFIYSFDYKDVELKKSMLYFLHNIFRKSEFRAGQEAIINRSLVGKDVIGLLPTGAGKSLTYQICSILHPGVTIVIDPINSLMKDQYDKLIDNKFTKIDFINSFNTKDEKEKNIENLTLSKYLIVFISPERFQIEMFRSSLLHCFYNNVFFSYAVIDEAHCVSEWGHDFRQVYLNLGKNIKNYCKPKFDKLPIIALTATASFDVLADVQRELKMPEDVIISLSTDAMDRKELNFQVIKSNSIISNNIPFWDREKNIGSSKYTLITKLFSTLPEKIKELENKIGNLNPNTDFFKKTGNTYMNAGLIFCPTKSDSLKNGVPFLASFLENDKNLEVGTFFGGGDDTNVVINPIDNKSYQNQIDFISNKTNLMVATRAFGMGIDKPNIRYTIHYTFPNSVENFYQEAGRSGRNRQPSLSTIIY
ncbi:MAG: ATP-dependent DNA helicase RecQ [Cytophagia bacterium]|nr:MAG: ATP-dependent DNA helicase RecQ [Cytophagia bacterium]TAG55135.1 MAG: ATP-dependent DNA helicase RecQ [Cytophagales bacterium]